MLIRIHSLYYLLQTDGNCNGNLGLGSFNFNYIFNFKDMKDQSKDMTEESKNFKTPEKIAEYFSVFENGFNRLERKAEEFANEVREGMLNPDQAGHDGFMACAKWLRDLQPKSRD